ncbi:MAG: PAS domain S-box protein [Burkholderiaceae bacterium]|nr:PAS domain S-box protein [Burkholderiaceae bacterium]
MQPSPTAPPLDFALLQQTLPRHGTRNRRALWWMLGFLVLVVASVVALVLYLHDFEQEEEERRRVADGQWLEQSARFHFNRLEDDLLVLARQGLRNTQNASINQPLKQGGLLWNEPGAVLWHGWQATNGSNLQGRWNADNQANPANAEALSSMLDIATSLRRSAYAGPMRTPDGAQTDIVWLAVPFFERGRFVNNYLAALSIDACVQGLVPPWFYQNHRIKVVPDGADFTDPPPEERTAYFAPLNLPGADFFVEVAALDTQPATVPRIFLLVALLFLLGMLVSLVALRRDIGKRQHVQALLQAQVVLRTAMENSVSIGLRAWAQNGQVLYVNEAFCRMVGYSAAELIGCSAPMPYWPAHQAENLEVLHRDVIAQGTREEGIEVQFQHRNGHLVDVLIHESPLTTARGEQVGWMSSVLDISERKRAQRLATQQQKNLEASGRLVAVGEVASTLAHELNQPLGALSSFANGLLNRLHSDSIALEDVAPVVARMARLSDKAGSIIQRVNAFARQRELTYQHFELHGFVKRCVATYTGHTPRLGATVQMLPAREPVWVQADGLLLEHVVNNLVANALGWAVRGAKQPGQVRVLVQVGADTGMAQLCVADTGPGVGKDDYEHIFNTFFSTTDGGMGMGLAICRSIVEAHHGRIGVQNDTELGGALFTVWLPLGDAPVAHIEADALHALHRFTASAASSKEST